MFRIPPQTRRHCPDSSSPNLACEPARAHGYSSIVPYCAAGRRPLLMSSRPGLQPAAARGKCVIGLGVLREFRVGRWGFAMGFAYDRAAYFTDLLRDNTCRSSKRQDGNKRRDRGHRNRRTLLAVLDMSGHSQSHTASCPQGSCKGISGSSLQARGEKLGNSRVSSLLTYGYARDVTLQ